MAQTNNDKQLEKNDELKSHIDEMEIVRRQLLMEYRIALFSTEYLKLKSLPSLNPLYLWFTKVKEIRKKKSYKMFFYVGVIIYFILVIMQFAIPSFPFNLSPVIVAILLITVYSPLLYWFYALYKRIELIVFRDYLKRDIRRELELLISYYILLCKKLERFPKVLNDSVNTTKEDLKELKEFHESIIPPKFLRNISLGVMSFILGMISIIKTITVLVLEIEAQTLIDQLQVLLPTPLITPLFEVDWGLLIMIPLEAVLILVVLPILKGVRESIMYSNEFFGTMEEKETEEIKEMLIGSSSFGVKILGGIP